VRRHSAHYGRYRNAFIELFWKIHPLSTVTGGRFGGQLMNLPSCC